MVALKVFGQPALTEVARVLACLFEKDLEFELIRIDTFKGKHKIPEFLQLQDPTGQVTLKDREDTFVDSRKIIRHLCTKFQEEGNRRLYGTGALERASVEQWLQAEALNFEPASSELVFYLAFAPHLCIPPNEPVIQRNERELGELLDVYNRRLQANRYLAGEHFSLADLSHLPNTHYLMKTERGAELLSRRKNVARWWEDISGQPSWKEVVRLQAENPGATDDGGTCAADI